MMRKSRFAANLARSYHVLVCVRLPPARRWRRGDDRDPACPRCNDAASQYTKYDSLCEAYCDSVEHALSASHLVDSDLPLDGWYGSVIGIIQQVASHHFGVKSAPPRCRWMTPPQHGSTSWHVRFKFRSSWSTGVPFCTWMTLGALFSACGTSLLAWGSWTAKLS